jgi:hypothetical protein
MAAIATMVNQSTTGSWVEVAWDIHLLLSVLRVRKRTILSNAKDLSVTQQDAALRREILRFAQNDGDALLRNL